jgi:hypothetical protein
MSQFNTVRSAKVASDLDARLRRHKLLEKGSAVVDRPEGGWRRPIPRFFPDNSDRSISLDGGGRR